jgi:hypothetical protein
LGTTGTTETGLDRERPRPVRFSRLAGHLIALAWIALMLVSARLAPDSYWNAMQEDRVVEWWTALLFFSAGAIALQRAFSHRRAGDALVALFCIFVAGEELSWGQRVIGYTPPAAFLEHNTQQELNLHNFREVLGQPKWMLAMVLGGYGLLLPALVRVRAGRRILEAVRLTAPPARAAPWFAAAIALLVWYPVEFTGEWVETLAGGLFLATLGGSVGAITTTALLGLGAAVTLSLATAQRAASPELVACARDETRVLASELASNATARLRRRRRIHKRVWTAVQEGYVRGGAARALGAVPCRGTDIAAAASRRRFVIDPWGTAYWLVTKNKPGDAGDLVVYSFGPNRRRDGETSTGGGDDIVARAELVR